MSRKVTIQDMADALGISRNTVSKAINNTGGLADATREKILQKAVEMGYKQFSYAGSFGADAALSMDSRPAYQGEIALLTGSFLSHSHFATLMLDKFQGEISLLGYTMNTHRVTKSDIANKTLPATVHMEQVKAILCVEMFDWNYDEMLCGLGIPVLFVDGPARVGGRSLPADQLYMDNATAITQFVNSMLQKGKTRIGFVGEYEHCQSFYERYTAYYLAMVMAGHPVEGKYQFRCNHLEELQEQYDRETELPEVLICANDFVAVDVIQWLGKLGKQVPEDVLVCGFDDAAESRLSKPPLTTVHIHTQIIAYTAVHLLMSRIKESSLDFRTVHTETDLIYRESTAVTK